MAILLCDCIQAELADFDCEVRMKAQDSGLNSDPRTNVHPVVYLPSKAALMRYVPSSALMSALGCLEVYCRAASTMAVNSTNTKIESCFLTLLELSTCLYSLPW